MKALAAPSSAASAHPRLGLRSTSRNDPLGMNHTPPAAAEHRCRLRLQRRESQPRFLGRRAAAPLPGRCGSPWAAVRSLWRPVTAELQWRALLVHLESRCEHVQCCSSRCSREESAEDDSRWPQSRGRWFLVCTFRPNAPPVHSAMDFEKLCASFRCQDFWLLLQLWRRRWSHCRISGITEL